MEVDLNHMDRILVAERARLGIVCGKHHQVLQIVGSTLEKQLQTVREGEGEKVSIEVDRDQTVRALDELRNAFYEMGGIVKSIYAEIMAATSTEFPEGFDPASMGLTEGEEFQDAGPAGAESTTGESVEGE